MMRSVLHAVLLLGTIASALDIAQHATRRLQIDDSCAEKEQLFYSCLQSSDFDPLIGLSCERCISDAVPSSSELCRTFDKALCPALETCECAGCRSEAKTYVTCAVKEATGCLLDCRSHDTADDLMPCLNETIDLNQCLASQPSWQNTNQCRTCTDGLYPAALLSANCNDWSTSVCWAASTCSCNGCEEQLTTLYECMLPVVANQACPIDCTDFVPPTATPTSIPPTPAPSKFKANEPVPDMDPSNPLLPPFNNTLDDPLADFLPNVTLDGPTAETAIQPTSQAAAASAVCWLPVLALLFH